LSELKLIYRRLPHQVDVFRQEALHEDAKLIVTRGSFKTSASLKAQAPWFQEPEYRAIWFIFEGAWYDLGKIYDLSGALQGYYCDIIRPARRTPDGLEIDDLILDLWVFPDGRWKVLDEEEFEEAVSRGWMEEELAARARRELERLIGEVESGRFPPQVVRKPWPIGMVDSEGLT